MIKRWTVWNTLVGYTQVFPPVTVNAMTILTQKWLVIVCRAKVTTVQHRVLIIGSIPRSQETDFCNKIARRLFLRKLNDLRLVELPGAKNHAFQKCNVSRELIINYFSRYIKGTW